ncbi:MAG: division/cell wall cluster transcriptional repressor MraZ [candidate division Zixibacteria bacterium]|nr:division/cell wall cluster transcriptional repressor MraZ [candidate division Zixibacteria bacterium]
MSGFYGQFHTTMDVKGRFALPSRLRNVADEDGKMYLDGNLILTKGLEGCLSLYPEVEWQTIQGRFSSLSFTKRNYRYFSRRFYSSAALVKSDKNGRILIPAQLTADAHLKKDLTVIGVNRSIEIWNPERFEYYLEQFHGSWEEVAEQLFASDSNSEE